VDVRLQGPRDHTGTATEPQTANSESDAEVELPLGPILLTGRRSGNSVSLSALAVQTGPLWLPLVPEGADPAILDRFVAERLTPGSRYTLFSEGVRVGTFVQTEAATLQEEGCTIRPVLSGEIEILPGAMDAQTFMALPEEQGADWEYRAFRRHASTYEQRVGSLGTARVVIPRVGAAFPPTVLETRRELRIVSLDGGTSPGLAASFVFLDDLQVGGAPGRAYSVFFTARPLPGGVFEADYLWYRRADDGGKAWPRLQGHLDLDRDGRDELLLEVFGDDSRWFQLEGYRGGAWRTLFADACAKAPGSAWQADGSPTP